MASLTKTFEHALTKEEAARRIRERISSEKLNKANIVSVSKEIWDTPFHLEFSMTIFKYRIDGDLAIGESAVELNLNLPMGASIFKGMIEDQISQQMNIMLS